MRQSTRKLLLEGCVVHVPEHWPARAEIVHYETWRVRATVADGTVRRWLRLGLLKRDARMPRQEVYSLA